MGVACRTGGTVRCLLRCHCFWGSTLRRRRRALRRHPNVGLTSFRAHGGLCAASRVIEECLLHGSCKWNACHSLRGFASSLVCIRPKHCGCVLRVVGGVLEGLITKSSNKLIIQNIRSSVYLSRMSNLYLSRMSNLTLIVLLRHVS